MGRVFDHNHVAEKPVDRPNGRVDRGAEDPAAGAPEKSTRPRAAGQSTARGAVLLRLCWCAIRVLRTRPCEVAGTAACTMTRSPPGVPWLEILQAYFVPANSAPKAPSCFLPRSLTFSACQGFQHGQHHVAPGSGLEADGCAKRRRFASAPLRAALLGEIQGDCLRPDARPRIGQQLASQRKPGRIAGPAAGPRRCRGRSCPLRGEIHRRPLAAFDVFGSALFLMPNRLPTFGDHVAKYDPGVRIRFSAGRLFIAENHIRRQWADIAHAIMKNSPSPNHGTIHIRMKETTNGKNTSTEFHST